MNKTSQLKGWSLLGGSLLGSLLLAVATLTPTSAARAQATETETMAPALPPPGIGDPGIEAVIEPAAVSDTDGVNDPTESGASAAPTDLPTAARTKQADVSLPEITVRTDPGTGDRVEEYRENGKLVRVVVQPKNGKAYIIHDANGDGRVDAKDSDGPVQPVYWELFSWD